MIAPGVSVAVVAGRFSGESGVVSDHPANIIRNGPMVLIQTETQLISVNEAELEETP